MSALVKHLSSYAAYHRDAKNIATHMLGIPMIVLAVAALLSRPLLHAGHLVLTPAMLLSILVGLFYLRLDLRFGAVMAVLLALANWFGLAVAAMATPAWLATGIGIFVLGWAIQFAGHYYEGRKPAFLDDVTGLIIGPLFIVAELAFLLGLRPDVRRAMTPAPEH